MDDAGNLPLSNKKVKIDLKLNEKAMQTTGKNTTQAQGKLLKYYIG